MTESVVTLREIARDMGVHATDAAWVDVVETLTAYAVQLDYPMTVGTGGAYADHTVTTAHAAILRDLVTNTDADGVYHGDRGALAALAADDTQGVQGAGDAGRAERTV